MASDVFDLLVIGSGPAGYTGAIRAAQLGLKVACVEKESQLGGTCLRVGCIPSKSLLHSSALYQQATQHLAEHGIVVPRVDLDIPKMQQRKSDVVKALAQGITGLFKKNRIESITALATLLPTPVGQPLAVQLNQKDGQRIVHAHKVLLACGSTEARLPGVELDFLDIGTSTQALTYSSVPHHLVIIGAGAIGLELGSVWRRLGAQVTVVEYLPRILAGMDLDLANQAQKILSKQGLVFQLEARVKSAKKQGQQCLVEIDGQPTLTCDKVLLAAGRVPYTEGLGLEALAVATDKRGRIVVDEHFQTSRSAIYAVGDVIAGAMLAHKAEEEAVACVEYLVNGYGHVDYKHIPSVVYTEPEIASVGPSEEQLKEVNIPYKKGVFPFMANARARAMGQTQGFVKLLAHAQSDRLLAGHLIAASGSELIHEIATAIQFGASSEDLARCCHAHPTLSEAIKEAALAVAGRTVNI